MTEGIVLELAPDERFTLAQLGAATPTPVERAAILLTNLGPGWRLINGRRLYSAAWLDDARRESRRV